MEIENIKNITNAAFSGDRIVKAQNAADANGSMSAHFGLAAIGGLASSNPDFTVSAPKTPGFNL